MRLRGLAIGSVVCAVSVSSLIGIAPTFAASESKVTICHRTNSTKNPYVSITVGQSSVNGEVSRGKGDHFAEHTGPIWAEGDRNGGDWGDIIPPIAGVHEGLNWTTEGEEIWNRGCDAHFAITGEPEESEGTDGETVTDGNEGDSDDDGVTDNADPDDDGDGIPDTSDADSDGDGVSETADQRLIELPKIEDVVESRGALVLATAATETVAGKKLAIRVVCTPIATRSAARSKSTGDVAAPRCKVTEKKGRTVLHVLGPKPVRVHVVWSADAEGIYKPASVTRTFVVR